MVRAESLTLSTMVDFSDRLKKALSHAERQPGDLQKHLPVSYQAIKKVLDGSSKSFSAENCAKAARYLGVSIYWLATGEGNMLDDQQPHAVNMVAERIAPYKNPQWPFKHVSPQQIAQLDSHQLCRAEGFIQALITEGDSQEKSATA